MSSSRNQHSSDDDDDNDNNSSSEVWSTIGKIALGAVIGAGVVIGAFFAAEAIKDDDPADCRTKKPVSAPLSKDDAVVPAADQQFPDDALELQSFICPITQEVFVDPVVTPYGHTYERHAIVDWIKGHATDPLTRQPLQESQLVPCYAIKAAIQQQKKMLVKQQSPQQSSQQSSPPQLQLLPVGS